LLVPGSTGGLTLLGKLANGDELTTTAGRKWKLDTADPRFRLAGAADIDRASDNKAELTIVSAAGLVILHKRSSGVVGPTAFDNYFMLRPGEFFPGTSVSGTRHWLAKTVDLDNSG